MSDMIIFIICLTVFVFSFSTSGYCGSLYRCVNSQGSVMLTDNIPTNPDYKCTFAASYRDSTPQERAKEQKRDAELRQRQQINRAQEEAQKQRKEDQESTKKNLVELEKRRLEERKAHLGDNAPNWKNSGHEEWSKGARKKYDEDIKELERDPEYYFYKKEQEEKAKASQPISNSGNTKSPGDFLPKVGKYRWQVE